MYLLGITLASCMRAVIILTFWRKLCFLLREVRFSDGILKFVKTHFSLERVISFPPALSGWILPSKTINTTAEIAEVFKDF